MDIIFIKMKTLFAFVEFDYFDFGQNKMCSVLYMLA